MAMTESATIGGYVHVTSTNRRKPTGGLTPVECWRTSMSTNANDGNESGVECPTCGRDDFASELGMMQHHGRVHGERLSQEEYTCVTCGCTFQASRDQRGRRKCCSPECQAKWQRESEINSGENSPSWDGGLVSIRCVFCNTSYGVKRSKAEKSRFCSRSCLRSWQSENMSGESHHMWGGRVRLICDNCGDSYERIPSQSGSRFCSQQCMGEWMSTNLTGDQNRAWKGGYTRIAYGSGFTEAKKERVRKRQGRLCAGCARPESIENKRLSVHHIFPARSFDNPADRNNESNLVALCHGCHKRWEGIPLRPQLID